MRVIAPRTRIDPEVINGLDATCREWEPVNLRHPDHYFELLACLWEAGETFAVVEHDIVLTGHELDELDDCDQDWCAFPYTYLGGYHYGLGCTKFSAALIARHPHALDTVGRMSDDTHPVKHYCRLDGWLAHVLCTGHESMHQHWPLVEHNQSNPGHSGHGCI